MQARSIIYVRDVETISIFDSTFIEAFVLHLASAIAMDVAHSMVKRDNLFQDAQNVLSNARGRTRPKTKSRLFFRLSRLAASLIIMKLNPRGWKSFLAGPMVGLRSFQSSKPMDAVCYGFMAGSVAKDLHRRLATSGRLGL
jgi:hypothetical protein